jgi:hypothetical protein
MGWEMIASLSHFPYSSSRIGGRHTRNLLRAAIQISSVALALALALAHAHARAADQASETPQVHPERFGLHVVDAATGRGLPLVELRTVNDIRYVTDDAGWVAFQEPGMMDREVFWHVSGPGIEREKDGFGFACFRATTKPGTSAVVKVKNTNIADRLARLTGQGLYRDSELLGLKHPLPNIVEPGVLGQDSVQMVPYQGKLFWLWGDTNLARYQLGNYQTTCGLTDGNAHPEQSLTFQYFTDPKDAKSLRKMMPTSEPGAVWMFGLMSIKDESGVDKLISGYSRQRGLVPPDEKGLAEFDDKLGHFKTVATISKDEKWRAPAGHAVRAKDAEGDYYYFCVPFAHTRVKADLANLRNPDSYETLRFDEVTTQWQWQKTAPPTTQDDERKLLESKQMKPEQAKYHCTDAANGALVKMHGASIQWNAWRKRYVLIGVQSGTKDSPSALGEVWYAESDAIVGPWGKAVKVANHPRYTYYNPVHHGSFDKEGGRIIYFEGTYTREFSGNPLGTMRYDYNQLMYRLDLSDPRLKGAQ